MRNLLFCIVFVLFFSIPCRLSAETIFITYSPGIDFLTLHERLKANGYTIHRQSGKLSWADLEVLYALAPVDEIVRSLRADRIIGLRCENNVMNALDSRETQAIRLGPCAQDLDTVFGRFIGDKLQVDLPRQDVRDIEVTTKEKISINKTFAGTAAALAGIGAASLVAGGIYLGASRRFDKDARTFAAAKYDADIAIPPDSFQWLYTGIKKPFHAIPHAWKNYKQAQSERSRKIGAGSLTAGSVLLVVSVILFIQAINMKNEKYTNGLSYDMLTNGNVTGGFYFRF